MINLPYLRFQLQNKLVKQVSLHIQYNQYKLHNLGHNKIIIEWFNSNKNVKKK